MSRPKKDATKQAADDAAVAFAHEKVAKNPRGAPEVIPAVWEDVPVVATVQVATFPTPVVRPATPCALEDAPLKSKCVVSRTEAGKVVRLLNAAGVTVLDEADLFYTLPAGAKVFKAAPDVYEVYRLGVQEPPIFIADSARDAVARFLKVVA